jgi:hypothetical protein
MPGSVATIEVVRGNLTGEDSEEILDFWTDTGALDDESAREQLDHVVCVAADETGEVVGVGSVQAESVPLVGRRFWVYRSFLAGEAGDLGASMFNAAFEALEQEFHAGGSGPIGVCMIVGDGDEMDRQPEAVWPDTELIFAGYLPDDRQVRIRYFWGATIGPGVPSSPSLEEAIAHDYSLEDRFRIEMLAESRMVTPDDVLALWAREGVVADAPAKRRIHQVQLVAITGEREVAGVSSIYLEHNPRLRMDLWYYRTFVASDHRRSNLAAQLIFRNRDLLQRRFVSGDDTRANAVVFELENEGMMRQLNNAYWPHSEFTFIGENEHGDHIRIHYFPGAQVPPPRPGG